MYTRQEEEKRKIAKQTERATVEQLKVQNKMLKAENRKFRDKESVSREKPQRVVRNYTVKDVQASELDDTVINFFSSNNKDLQADLHSSGKRTFQASRSRSNNKKEVRPQTAAAPLTRK